MPRYSDLIIVPCHCVFLDAEGTRWAGGYAGEGPLYLAHARRGVELASAALLIFSGGATQASAGPRTEARSYLDAARHYRWWGHPEPAAATEEYARDSFENLRFSIARFKELMGVAPAHVTVVGWEFKRERFGLHREAIGWPEDRFRYEGVNNPADLATALAAERALIEAVRADPHLRGPMFEARRATRDPFGFGEEVRRRIHRGDTEDTEGAQRT